MELFPLTLLSFASLSLIPSSCLASWTPPIRPECLVPPSPQQRPPMLESKPLIWFMVESLSICTIPTHHMHYQRFRINIVELWISMEQQVQDNHPLKECAVNQLIEYHKTCKESDNHSKLNPPPNTLICSLLDQR